MKRIILISLMIIMSLSAVYAQKIYVVSVGVSDYPGTQYDLSLTVNDAKTIKWLYDKNNKAETVLLTNSQATSRNILYYMDDMFSKAEPDDIVLFFFSGHGYPGGFVGYNDDYITYDDIKKVFAKSKSNNKMIFADACYSGTIRESNSNASSNTTPSDFTVLLFLSSRSDETSIERSDMENGYFTTYLQKGLRGNADTNRDRTVTAKELFVFVSNGVTKISNDKQHPVMWGKFSDNMPVVVW